MSITVWYLEMTAPEQLRPARARGLEVAIEQIHLPSAEGSRRLYEQVGRPWRWSDRAAWDDAAWEAHVGRPEVETWVATIGGEQAGYAEDSPWARAATSRSPPSACASSSSAAASAAFF